MVAHAAVPEMGAWTVDPGDAAGIQAALNVARDAGGGSVHLPAAVYVLTAKVRVHSNVTVYGDGVDRTILRWAPGATVDHMMSNGSLAAGNANLQIRDLSLDGEMIPSGRDDCCFGLRLSNVRDSYVVNVAADGHSKDGIYLGDSGSGGAVNVRVSGCRTLYNARNGISLVHGDGVIIDHCRVDYNNVGEKVAGIDVEPDEGQSVTNSKLIANNVNGQDVGVRLFVPFPGYATVANNAICQGNSAGNRGASIFDYNGSRNIYVDNASRGGGRDFRLDPSARIGSSYASACHLPALPPSPNAATGS